MKQVIIDISNQLTIKRLPPHLIPKIRELLIIENPLYKENESHGHSNYKTPRKLRFISKDSKRMPRGFINTLRKLLKKENIDYRIRLQTTSRQCSPALKSNISFASRPYGAKAVEKILKRRFGVLQAPTGSGKTVIAIETIVQRNEHTLIVVHTKELMYQWRDKLIEFTDILEGGVGLIGDGHKSIASITIGIINSLRYEGIMKTCSDHFGYVIVDECHRVPSTVFSKFLVNIKSKYMLGLSATPYRRDGLTQVIHFFMGDIVHEIKTKRLQKQGHILKADLKIIETSFSPYVGSVNDYPKIIKALTKDEDRNNLIIRNVYAQALIDNGIILVISDRIEHCFSLQLELVSKTNFPTCLLTGKSSKRERRLAIQTLNENKGARILVATGQLIGEGFDSIHLSSIFICTPIRWEGRLIQYIGRILRIAEGKKKATIFDFHDPCWLLEGSYNKRLKAYREMGIIK